MYYKSLFFQLLIECNTIMTDSSKHAEHFSWVLKKELIRK